MNRNFRIRVARAEDAAAVGALLEASYTTLMPAGYPWNVLEPALPLMVRANPILLRSGTFHVAVNQENGLIGCGGWTLERPGALHERVDASLGHIRHFATHPGWTGMGVGRAVFDRCRQQALDRGVGRFECYSSHVAVPFYAALGFTEVKRVTVAIGPGIEFPSVLMISKLT